MKRYVIPMMLMAAAALASCEKQNTVIEPEAEKATYTYTLSATAPEMEEAGIAGNAHAPATRTDYTSTGIFSWSAGDAISVLFHNGTTNKFFTLTTTGSGATASFSGEIETGYTIGASDGDASDKKIWALFPASANHTYTSGSNPKFYIPAETDFTTGHFSANLPMYSLNTAEGSITFDYLTCAYKFTVTGIDKDKAPKIRATVTNQLSYALSGIISMSSGPYLSFGSLENASQTVSYVCDASEGSATFYVPCRYYAESFKPTITITNYSTGVPIKRFTASKATAITNKGKVQPIILDVSDGDYFAPAISINGDFSDWDPSTNDALTNGTNYLSKTGGSYYKEFKVAYDSRYVYFYSKRNYNAALWSDDGYYYFYLDWGSTGTDDVVFYLKPFTKGDANSFNSALSSNFTTNTRSLSSFTASCAGYTDGLTDIETEIRILRTDLGISGGNSLTIASSGNKDAAKVTLDSALTF